MFASWEPALAVFEELWAEKALFVDLLTVENHHLSYQEMSPKGHWRSNTRHHSLACTEISLSS